MIINQKVKGICDRRKESLDFVYTKRYIKSMKFEWDEQKNRTNIIKHGISFQEAIEIFKDPNLLTYKDNRFNYEETRELSIGQLFLPKQPVIVILVVHTDRNGVTRIISARRASRKERKIYDQQSI